MEEVLRMVAQLPSLEVCKGQLEKALSSLLGP